MATSSKDAFDSLAPVGSVAFFVGGLSILLDVVLQGAATFSSFTFPEWLNVLFGLGGLWVATFGLIGFYSHLADPPSRWAQGGLVTGSVASLILTVGLGWGILLDILGRSTLAEGPGIAPQIVLIAVVSALLSFLAYGVASLRAERPSASVGYLLLIPFASFVLLVAIFIGSQASGTNPPEGVGVVLFGVVAVSIIALGYNLIRRGRIAGGF